MAEKEITRNQFIQIMNDDSYVEFYSTSKDDPANQVTHIEAIVFSNKLSQLEGLEPVYSLLINGVKEYNTDLWGDIHVKDPKWYSIEANWDVNGYRIPTESEWFWAAIGASQENNAYKKQFSGSNGENNAYDYAWLKWNSKQKVHNVGLKKPNELGIYDMTGNVWELCWDRYQLKLPDGPLENYRGPEIGIDWTVKGGGILSDNDSYSSLIYRHGNRSISKTRTRLNDGIRIVRGKL